MYMKSFRIKGVTKMAEILGGHGLDKAIEELGVQAKCTYKGGEPHCYEVWELSKHELKKLEEEPVWDDSWGWYVHAIGSRMGSVFEILTIKRQTIIGWETLDKETEYDCLTDYFAEGLGVTGGEAVAALGVDLAKANSMTLGKLFALCEG